METSKKNSEKNENFEQSHSAEKCEREALWAFPTSTLIRNIEKIERGTLWRHQKIFRKRSHKAEKVAGKVS